MERLRQEVKRVCRYGPPVSLLMIDIDFFKKVNDTYGHQAGGTVLAGVATLINERLRETDLIVRYGGEEFCLLATGTERPGAKGSSVVPIRRFTGRKNRGGTGSVSESAPAPVLGLQTVEESRRAFGTTDIARVGRGRAQGGRYCFSNAVDYSLLIG